MPAGHRVDLSRDVERARPRIEIADLLGAGLIEEGATLHARSRDFTGRTATVLPDGSLDIDGVPYSSPSGAAGAITGRSTNGWWFWLLDDRSRRSLNDLWLQYVNQTAADADDSELPEDDDE